MVERATGAWRAVAVSMAIGAVYDIAFATAILLFARPAAGLLSLTLPADGIYLRLNGIFLLLLGGMYLLPALAPVRYQGVVAVAAAGRTLGFVFLLGAWAAGQPPAFLGLALADLAFGAAHATLLMRARRS